MKNPPPAEDDHKNCCIFGEQGEADESSEILWSTKCLWFAKKVEKTTAPLSLQFFSVSLSLNASMLKNHLFQTKTTAILTLANNSNSLQLLRNSSCRHHYNNAYL